MTFNDVYGLKKAKDIFLEIISYLRNKDNKYREIGSKLRKGILLYGPSGTGKTLLAKAVAGECKTNFIYKSASEFNQKYMGEGSNAIRQLFNRAKELSPCIIFIDELDAIGKRGMDIFNYSSQLERSNTINQLLTELDGF